MHSFSVSKCTSLHTFQENDDTHATYINALCNWNRADDVLELASEWLEEGFKAGLVVSKKVNNVLFFFLWHFDLCE